MNTFQNKLLDRAKAGLFLLVLTIWGCSDPLSLEDEGLTLTNRTTINLVFSVFEQETSNLAFISPKILVRPDHRILQPDETATIFEDDITVIDRFRPIEDVSINLWEVVGDSAFIRGGIQLTNEELRERKLRVEIEEDADGSLIAGSAN